jgi:hypothetical protein
MPLLAGKASKTFLKASRPPAEAPSATTGKSTLARFGDARRFGSGRIWPGSDALRPVIVLAFVSPGSHRGTLAGQFHLITYHRGHDAISAIFSQPAHRDEYIPQLDSSVLHCTFVGPILGRGRAFPEAGRLLQPGSASTTDAQSAIIARPSPPRPDE